MTDRRKSDIALWQTAYPDGDPYADSITVCRECGAVARHNTSGTPSETFSALSDAYDAESEALADDYDGDCAECGAVQAAAVYEVADRDHLEEIARERGTA